MELNSLDIKILKLLSNQNGPVNLAYINKKCVECESSLIKLYKSNYIDSSWIDSYAQIGFPSFDDITITKEGREYLARLKLDKKHTTKVLNKKEFWEIAISIFAAIVTAAILSYLAI